MKSTAIVSEKGQITLPKKLRDRLGIRPGDQLVFAEQAGQLVARKLTREHPVDRVYGILKLRRSTDELIEVMRGKADAT